MERVVGIILRRMALVKPILEWILRVETWMASCWVTSSHRRLMAVQWGLPPQPEQFDHQIDLYYQWLSTRNSLWLERGVFGSLALLGGNVLELSCGDGFNARNFYSLRSRRIIACDFDPKAIRMARTKNACQNVEYVLADIRTNMPDGNFENIVWDGAIEHFTQEEIKQILKDIKRRLITASILSGHTIVERLDGLKSLEHHEYEFKSKEDLLRLLSPYFKNVTVFETIYESRHNLYFWASEKILPFGRNWPYTVSKSKD